MYNVQQIREDFPILKQFHHDDVPLIYLDNAASSQKPRQVIEQIDRYYREYHANVHRGIHKLSEQATEAYEGARKKVQRFIGAKSWREVIFTRGTTESVNLVAQTWGRENLKVSDVVLSTVMEHHANIVPWQILASEKGFSLRFVPLNADGTLDMDAYKRILAEGNVKLVLVTHCSNVLATINPVQEMAKLAHEAGALILVDAAQSVPHLPLNVQTLDADFLAFSSHKMLGATGVGILYGKRDLLEEMPVWQGGGDMIAEVTLEGFVANDLPYKFEAGTPSIAEAISLGYAVDYLETLSMPDIHAHCQNVTAYAYQRLSDMAGITTYGHAKERGSVVAFTVEGVHAHDVAQLLDSQGVAVRAGHHCAMPLHQHLGISASVRASFYIYSTLEEVDVLVRALHHAKKFAL